MNVEIIKCLEDNYSYLIIDSNKNACVVDPSEEIPVIASVESNQVNLKYILNTHHHFDHIGGNLNLKKKYNAKVIGYVEDKHRIPGIDIELKDKEIWNKDGFSLQVFHIPGHTSGHICFYFKKEKLLFTGDTLFSLGCGRIFEGTYEQMFSSLQIFKNFPKETKIFCGHEYTMKNAEFCKIQDQQNEKLNKKFEKIKNLLDKGLPTIPTTIEDELDCNIFLKSEDLETFSKLRDLKDNF